MTRYLYPIDLEDLPEGRVLACAPDLDGCLTDGADRAEALAEAADAVEETLASAMKHGLPIPLPSATAGRPTAGPGAVMAAKLALYENLRASGLSNAAFARKIGVQENEVRRMLNPRHATKMARLETALAWFGKRLVVAVEDAA